MKKFLVLAAIVFICMAGSAFAATVVGTANVNISATVASNCTSVSVGALTLAIDPTAGAEVDSTGSNTKVQCTAGPSYAVSATSAGSGNNSSSGTLVGHLKAAGLADISYTLFFTPTFSGLGTGLPADDVTLIIGSGSSASSSGAYVTALAAGAAQAGSYTDTVTMTISY
jgi:spore coat protein U-like protein